MMDKIAKNREHMLFTYAPCSVSTQKHWIPHPVYPCCSWENNYHNEQVHEISNNIACATSKASDQPAHTRSRIRAFASCLSIL